MTTAGTAVNSTEPSSAAIIDVWSRSGSKYRVRAVILLIVNVILFAGMGCFAYWLRSGIALAPAEEGYWQMFVNTCIPRGDATLANYVIFPIPINRVPWHGVVVGLLLAALVSIPILISILYRFPACLPFLLVVAFLAVMPWLAITLTGSCILASVKPFRMRFRYASALLGLLLVLIYFVGASRQSSAPLDFIKPEDRIKFMAPWVLAAIASCLIMGGVLLLARLVNYRPGVVAPLLVVSFAVPVALFERFVGRDELHYRLLEHQHQVKFHETDVSEAFEELAFLQWMAKPKPKPAFDVVRSNLEFRLSVAMEAAGEMESVFAEDRDAIIHRCAWFLRYFPLSRYAPSVLYIKGQVEDMRLDETAFREDKIIRYYGDFPAGRSWMTWKKLAHNAPESDVGVAGGFKLAVLSARAGKMDAAIDVLTEIIAEHDLAEVSTDGDAPTESSILASEPADASLKIPVDQLVFKAKQLLQLLRANGADPLYNLRPFCGSRVNEKRKPGLLQLDTRHPMYESNLNQLLEAYPGSLLEDNVSLRIALLATDPQTRLIRLQDCVTDTAGDALPETIFRLGNAFEELDKPADARSQYETLLKDHPQCLWVREARDRLRSIGAAAAEESS